MLKQGFCHLFLDNNYCGCGQSASVWGQSPDVVWNTESTVHVVFRATTECLHTWCLRGNEERPGCIMKLSSTQTSLVMSPVVVQEDAPPRAHWNDASRQMERRHIGSRLDCHIRVCSKFSKTTSATVSSLRTCIQHMLWLKIYFCPLKLSSYVMLIVYFCPVFVS